MKKPKHIIFDCDGVLVDSEILANKAEVELKTELGFPITLEEQIKTFTGLSWHDPVLQAELQRLPSDYLERLDERVKILYQQELRTINGVMETLKAVTLPICVASNSEIDWLDYKLTITGIKSYFNNAAFSRQLVKRGKPAPDLFLHAVETLGWSAPDCLVVEDSVAGVTAGRAAGMIVCGFIGGAHIYPGQADKLLAAGADYIVSDIRSVLRLI